MIGYDIADGLDYLYNHPEVFFDCPYVDFVLKEIEYSGAPHKDSVTVYGVLGGWDVELQVFDHNGVANTCFYCPSQETMLNGYELLITGLTVEQIGTVTHFVEIFQARLIRFANDLFCRNVTRMPDWYVKGYGTIAQWGVQVK